MARTLLAIAGCCLVLATVDTASAQRRTPGYANRPALSPYVNLFQANNGGLNSYFSFVRPRQEMDKFMRQQSQRNYMQQQFVAQEAYQIQRTIEDTLEENQLQLRPTSSGNAMRRPAARYMQFSPFFPNGGTVQARSRQQ
ncbi:MAG: hypothetical protein KDA92_15485 [Planctomycetales bacterium]|nr:hypothetical protein [Planctomycetales bacterium]MCA9172229.1 hypothetical protein [Planctomycetales bacterium]